MTSNSKNISKEARSFWSGFLFVLRWLASFVWPVRLHVAQSDNEYLEVSMYAGKVMLNSRKANYSYGNLQDAFEAMFEQTKLQLLDLKSVLILGYGAGGVARYLSQLNSEVIITGVDSSEILKDVLHYFKTVPRSTLITADAESFIASDTKVYDMVIVDLYQDLDVPEAFHETKFIQACCERLSDEGILVFNKVVHNDHSKIQKENLLIEFAKYFKTVHVNKQFDLNHFILGSDKRASKSSPKP